MYQKRVRRRMYDKPLVDISELIQHQVIAASTDVENSTEDYTQEDTNVKTNDSFTDSDSFFSF